MVKLHQTNTALWAMLLLVFCALPAGKAQAQDLALLKKKISINLEKADLKTALEKISDASGVAFNYTSAVLAEKETVSIHATNKTVEKVLDQVLSGFPFSYRVFEGEVMIRYEPAKLKKPEAPPAMKVAITAQPAKPIRGVVANDKGQKLAGATVFNEKTKKSTMTNEQGAFSIEASEGDELFISFVGYAVKRIKVGSADYYTIALAENQRQLDAITVVSTGYQHIDKRKMTGAVYTLKSEDLVKAGTVNIDGLLQGKVPGLTVVNNSGSPSATPTLRIRGTSTFVGNAAPLWVVDGLIQEDPVNLSPLQTDIALSQARQANFSIIGNAIAGINPNDIESITFLKDAAAASIYGVRAANGVIVVTTKRGKAGAQPSFNYNAEFGFSERPGYDDLNLMNSKERIEVAREVVTQNLQYQAMPFPNSYEGLIYKLWNREITQTEFDQRVGQLQSMNTDWFKLLFRNSFSQRHSLSLSGGSAKNTYYASIGFDDAKGSAIGDDLTRYSAMLKINTQVNDRLKIDFKINAYTRKAKGFFSINPFDYAYKTSRTIDANTPYSTVNTSIGVNEYEVNPPTPLFYQYTNERAQTGNRSDNKGVTGVISLQYKILPNLWFESVGGAGFQHTESEQWATEQSFYVAKIRRYNYGAVVPGSPEEKASQLPFGGVLHYMSANNSTYTLRNSLSFTKTFFGNDHLLSLFAGQEIRSSTNKGMQVQEWGYFPERGRRISYEYSTTPGLSADKHNATVTDNMQNYMSYFATASYSIRNKYILNANMRSDASNRFGQYTNNRFLPAYSVSARWSIAEENLLKNSQVVNTLNLRASYGIQGNVVTAVGPELIAYYPNSGIDRLIDPWSSQYLLRLRSLAYPDLRWEKTNQLNIGLDLGLFNDRVNIVTDFYQKRSKDLLLLVNIPYENGWTGLGGLPSSTTPPAMYVNAARVTNYGIEGRIAVVPVRTREWEWSMAVIASHNTNRSGSSGMLSSESNYLNGTAVINGKATNGLWSYSYKGVNPENGLPIFNNLETEGKTAEYKKDPANMLVYSGKSVPDITGGIQTQLSYRDFQFTAAFTYSLGSKRRLNPLFGRTSNVPNYAPQPEVNLSKELVNRWRQPGDEAFTNIPAIMNRDGNQSYVLLNGSRAFAYYMYDMSDARVVSGNFLRCSNMSLGYNIPVSFLNPYKIKQAGVRLSANNLFLVADKRLKGQDPEIDGVGTAALPMLPSYYLSISVGF